MGGAGPVTGVETLIVLGLLLAAGYVLASALWPFAVCRRCSGTGKRRSPTGKAWRPCGRCEGAGKRVRLGRLLWEPEKNSDGL
jgi:hypothetical protein